MAVGLALPNFTNGLAAASLKVVFATVSGVGSGRSVSSLLAFLLQRAAHQRGLVLDAGVVAKRRGQGVPAHGPLFGTKMRWNTRRVDTVRTPAGGVRWPSGRETGLNIGTMRDACVLTKRRGEGLPRRGSFRRSEMRWQARRIDPVRGPAGGM